MILRIIWFSSSFKHLAFSLRWVYVLCFVASKSKSCFPRKGWAILWSAHQARKNYMVSCGILFKSSHLRTKLSVNENAIVLDFFFSWLNFIVRLVWPLVLKLQAITFQVRVLGGMVYRFRALGIRLSNNTQ